MTRAFACIIEAGFCEDFFTWCLGVATAFEWTLDFAGWSLFRFAPGFTFEPFRLSAPVPVFAGAVPDLTSGAVLPGTASLFTSLPVLAGVDLSLSVLTSLI